MLAGLAAAMRGTRCASIWSIILHTSVLLLSVFSGAQSRNAASCYVFGTQHVLTFDKQRIDFNSDMEFTIAKTCPPTVAVSAAFHISVINEYKYPNADSVTRAKCVKVIFKGYTSQLCSDQTAQVDGDAVKDSILIGNSELMIYYGTNGRELAIQVGSTLIRVTITKQAAVIVTVPESYKSKLCGLCGNYDGSRRNDLQTSFGNSVSSIPSRYQQGALIAQSYVVLSSISPAMVREFVPSECHQLPQEQKAISEPQLCGIYEGSGSVGTAFSACLTKKPALANTFLEICKYDYCENYLTTASNEETSSGCDGDATCSRNDTLAKEATNSIAEVFADVCNSLNQPAIGDWRKEYDAERTCPSGKYSSDGPYCPNVCGLAANRCAETGIDGCICPSGRWKEGNTCVPRSTCGCSDGNTGAYYKVSDWWIDNLCTRKYTCVATNSISSVILQCSENSVCTPTGCECGKGYVGDGTTCRRTCPMGEQAVADVCEPCPIGSYKEAAGVGTCTACPTGQITLETGSQSASSCKEITMAPDSSYSVAYTQVADQSFKVVVPTDVLPNGLPFGTRLHRKIWVSTNGVISFGNPFVGRNPKHLLSVTQPLLAPFWFRQDLRVRGGISPVTNSRRELINLPNVAELRISAYNQLESNQARQAEAANSLNQIQVLMNKSPKIRALSKPFVANYAVVISWKNTVPNPALFYQFRESVYYQCIIVTNGIKTYAIYIYPPGGLTLLSIYQIRSIYMGFNAQDGGVHQFNYYKSGTIGIDQLDFETSNTDVAGRWVFEVASLGPDNPYAISCLTWYIVQRFYLFPFGVLEPLADPCPCNKVYAKYDERFYFDYSTGCAYSLNKKFTLTGHSLFQRCCYYKNGGSLITAPTKAGYPMYFHPLMSYALYEAVDLTPFIHCCKRSAQCKLYRTFRPVDHCVDYKAPAIACGYGDPHIMTLDQERYTYNPIGEFWMIKSDLFTMQARMIQSLDQELGLVNATQFGAFVMKSLPPANSSTVHLEINNNRTDFEVRVDGKSISNRLDSDVIQQVLSYDGVVVKKVNRSISVSFASGFSFRFSLRLNVLSIQTFVPESAMGQIDGLVGHYDGNSTNDLRSRNGTLVCVIAEADCTTDKIHREFGETWRLQDGESLFWYRPGWSTATYTDLSFQPAYAFPSTNQTLLSLCNNDLDCVFDVFITKDAELGQDTANTRTEVDEKATVLSTAAPTVVGMSSVNFTVNEARSVMYSANYNGTNTVELFALSKPPSATFEKDPSGIHYTLTWTPTDLTPHTIHLSANETGIIDGTAAVSSIFEVSILLSDDCQNGQSDFDTLAVGGALTPTFSVVNCECDTGWVGTICEEDYDGCVDTPCIVGECVDVPAASYDPINGTTYECNITDCPTGYERKSIDDVVEPDCSDIDECLNSTCIKANCANNVGSFDCICLSGYTMVNGSTIECTNVDECGKGLDYCEHLCTDTDGAFVCSCLEGYHLHENNYTCVIEPLTATTTARPPEAICSALNCAFTCTLNGTCACPRGQTLNADRRSCDEIDECRSGTHVCHTESGATCHDFAIGYECRCPPVGYQLLVNNYNPCVECSIGFYGLNCTEKCACGDRAKTCNVSNGCVECNPGWEGEQCATDINECDDDPCGSTATCTNTPGSYFCECPDGFINSNFTDCKNIDECTTYEPCSKLAKCTDTEGSYTCTCNDGYFGDGVSCYDVNECSPTDGSDSPCANNAITCQNEHGSYSCICPVGFQGNGKADGTGCENDNECREASNICEGANSECVDSVGSYSCVCSEGYFGDGVLCEDVDECAEIIYDCTAYDNANGIGTCTNTDGGYICETTCDEGYNRTTENFGNYSCTLLNKCDATPHPCDVEKEFCTSTGDSFKCTCLDGFERTDENSTCLNIDECARNNHNCSIPINGQVACVDMAGSFRCDISCDIGYGLSVISDTPTCVDVNECDQIACNAVTEDCKNLVGSYMCACKAGFANVSDTCTDINECLNPAICGGDRRLHCTNLEPSYNCSCLYGFTGDNCEKVITTAEKIEVEQVLRLDFNTDWADDLSDARVVFNSLMAAALAPMFGTTPELLGVNILSVSIHVPANSSSTRQKRATLGFDTAVRYNAVFEKNVNNADVIHRALDYLIAKKYKLTFNGTEITDLLMLAFVGVYDKGEVTCDTVITSDGVTRKVVDCQGRGVCHHTVRSDYPMCLCDSQYEGYNCGSELDVNMEGTGNLLALWVSVAVAAALLLGGLLACTLVLVHQRRQRAPSVHRKDPQPFSGRGPALFNPASRLPTEAFNYQFPVGSVRDDMSDSASTTTVTTNRTQNTKGRVGSTVPFVPRWPRAYYAQLGDPDDN